MFNVVEHTVELNPRQKHTRVSAEHSADGQSLPQSVEQWGSLDQYVPAQRYYRFAHGSLGEAGIQEVTIEKGDTFGKTGRPTGIEHFHHVPSANSLIRVRRYFTRARFQESLKGKIWLAKAILSFRNRVECLAQEPLPQGQQLDHIGDDGPFQTGLIEHLFNVPEIGVQADNGVRTGVIHQIHQVCRRIDGTDGNRYHPDALHTEP